MKIFAATKQAFLTHDWEKNRTWWMLGGLFLIVCLVLWSLRHLLLEIPYADIEAGIRNTDASTLGWALLATLASYVALMGYDASSLRYVGAKVAPRYIALTSFIAFALGNNVGIGPLTGGAVRMRIYAASNVEASAILRAIGFNTAAFGLGLSVVGAIGLLFGGNDVAEVLHVPSGLLVSLAIFLLLAITALIVLCFRKNELKIGQRWSVKLPSGPLALQQLVISCTEIVAASLVLWVLLPHAQIDYAKFIAFYAIGLTVGVVSHVPGGLGVFEAIILLCVGQSLPRDQLFTALILYRCIYYLLPLFFSLVLLAGFEMQRGIAAPAARAAKRMTPIFLAVFTLVVAVMLLLSGALPATDEATDLLELNVPLPLVEASHLISSLAGLVLLFVARGILHRLDAAWWIALFMTGIAFVLSLPKGISLVEMSVLGFLVVLLVISRQEFHRRASLFSLYFSFEWWLLIFSITALMLWVLFFAYRDIDYAHELWWQFEFNGHAPRSMRAVLTILLSLVALSLWRMLQPSPLRLAAPDAQDLAKAAAIIKKQPSVEAGLAMMGDKYFLFSDSGNAFLMFGSRSHALVSLFDPIGPEAEFEELIWRFREMADDRGVRAAFYQVRPQYLPLYLDAGFRVYKLGEYAWVPLAEFSLQGSKRANLRQGCARASRQGLKVEIIPVEETPLYMATLKNISDAWLQNLQITEKGFSLGAFTETYVTQQAIALVRHNDKVVAFATLMITDMKDEVSVDLMRYAPQAPPSTMEYLFVQLMLHFQAQGYQRFGLGMAPLSGMAEHPLAPFWHQAARLIFNYGEDLYHFQGLRSFKEKFIPVWEPRYLAATGNISAVNASMDVASLISGNLRKVVNK